MSKLFIILIMLSSNNAFLNSPSEKEVRDLYKKAANQETACKDLIALLEPYTEKNNIVLAGYKACATMMMANYVFFPINKLQKFSEGKELLEKSISQDPYNIEVRFLRFTVQTSSPSFLGYNKSIESDKVFLINSLSKMNSSDLKKMIISFLSESSYVNSNEKKQIKS